MDMGVGMQINISRNSCLLSIQHPKSDRLQGLVRFARRKASLWCLIALFTLLIGCDYEKHKAEKYRASVNPENGKIVEVDGEKFRIVYIGGVRFRFPDTPQFGGGGYM